MKKTLYVLLFVCFSFSSFSLIAKEEKNALIVCENSLEMLQWDLDFIRQATQSIDFVPCFFGGVIAQDFLSAIEARLKVCPDIKVHILASGMTLNTEDTEFIKRLTLEYPHNFQCVFSFMLPSLGASPQIMDNHVKMLIVDEWYFSAGGTNFTDCMCAEGTTKQERAMFDHPMSDLFPAGGRDQDIIGRGSLAKKLRQNFYKIFSLWEHFNTTKSFEINPDVFEENAHYFPVYQRPYVPSFESSRQLLQVEPENIKLILSGPHQIDNLITREYIELVDKAQEEIVVANFFFYPSDSLFQAFLRAVNRGVKFKLITNGANESAPASNRHFVWANRMNYLPILYGKTFSFIDACSMANRQVKDSEIYEYDVEDIMYHKKMMIVDRKIVLIGSFNLGTRSHTSDYEQVLVIHSTQVAAEALKVIKRDLIFSKKIEPKQACDWYFDWIIAIYAGLQQQTFWYF